MTKKKFLEYVRALEENKTATVYRGLEFEGDFVLIEPEASTYWKAYGNAIGELVFKKINMFCCVDVSGRRWTFQEGTEFRCVGDYEIVKKTFKI